MDLTIDAPIVEIGHIVLMYVESDRIPQTVTLGHNLGLQNNQIKSNNQLIYVFHYCSFAIL